MDHREFVDALTNYVLSNPFVLFKDLLERPSTSCFTDSSTSSSSRSSPPPDSWPAVRPPPGFSARPLVPTVPIAIRDRKKIPRLVCHFCKRNNESVSTYTSHVCKDKNGIVVCPVLRNLSCDICGSNGGDYAHTRRYCPMNPDKSASRGAPLPPHPPDWIQLRGQAVQVVRSLKG